MRKHTSVAGQRFGKLLALEIDHIRSGGQYMYKCKCDCGKIHLVSVHHLNSGKVWRCHDCSHRKGQRTQSELYRYKYDASKRGYEFAISKRYFKLLKQKDCHYCGESGPNGIDRKDNSRGYIEGNVVACCEMCNRMKMAYGYNEFLRRVRRIAQYRVNRKDNTSTG